MTKRAASSAPKMTSGRILRRAVVVALGIGVLGVGGSVLQSVHVRRAAEAFLEESRHLDVGSSSYAQVRYALRQFHRYESANEPCSPQKCQLQYRFDNIGMRILRLAPPTGFYFSFDFQNGRLTSKEAVLGQGICCAALVREVRFNAAETEGRSGYEVVPNGAPYKVLVTLDTRATAEERRISYQFNLSCLTALGGCGDAHQLLPGVWR